MYDEFIWISKSKKISYEVYKTIIEPMYSETPENISKKDFVKMLNLKWFEKYSEELAKSEYEKGFCDENDNAQQFMPRGFENKTGKRFPDPFEITISDLIDKKVFCIETIYMMRIRNSN